MTRARKLAGLSLATGLVVAGTLAGAPVAHADEQSGTQTCTGAREVRMRVDVGAAGNGTWINRNTGASKNFTFPGGASYRWAPYQVVRWSVYTPTFFYAQTTTTCI